MNVKKNELLIQRVKRQNALPDRKWKKCSHEWIVNSILNQLAECEINHEDSVGF